ncbi:MAG: hypothetical protein ACRDNY_01830 [Gaiellaceae bacterium]
MTRRIWGRLGRVGRVALWVLAALAVPVAIALAVVAVDTVRTPGEVTSDDARFQTSPMRQRGLWNVGFLPRNVSETLLGLEDDVEYRKLLGLYLRVEPGRVDYQGFPELESMRAKMQFELTRMSREDRHDPVRQSRLLTLYGVVTLDGRPLDERERQDMIQKAVSAFRNAIELDPSNVDAKTNLEAALSIFGPVVLPGEQPTGGANQGNTSGQGSTGSGY